MQSLSFATYAIRAPSLARRGSDNSLRPPRVVAGRSHPFQPQNGVVSVVREAKSVARHLQPANPVVRAADGVKYLPMAAWRKIGKQDHADPLFAPAVTLDEEDLLPLRLNGNCAGTPPDTVSFLGQSPSHPPIKS